MTEPIASAVAEVRDLREKAEAAGLVEPDPWAALDSSWKGPDVDTSQVAIVGAEAIEAVRKAYLEGRAEATLVVQAIDLAKAVLPLALKL